MLGYAENNKINVTHIFLVDDLKLYTCRIRNIQKLLELGKAFSQNIRIDFMVNMLVNLGRKDYRPDK